MIHPPVGATSSAIAPENESSWRDGAEDANDGDDSFCRKTHSN